LVIEPKVFRDQRGFFLETFHQRKLAEQGFSPTFVQDNHSLSTRATLRGLHAQRLEPQGKLVRTTEGEIFDVAVDLRLDSPTYRRWYGVRLSAENFRQLYIPPGFAHGFSVLSACAQVQYKCTTFYNAADEISVRWSDPSLFPARAPNSKQDKDSESDPAGGIDWHLGGRAPSLSERDAKAPLLAEIEPLLRDSPAYRRSCSDQ